MNSVLGQPKRYRGYVDKWFEDKGFGFVTLNGEQVFLHITKFDNYVRDETKIRVGTFIEAGVISAVKGRQAIDVCVLEY